MAKVKEIAVNANTVEELISGFNQASAAGELPTSDTAGWGVPEVFVPLDDTADETVAFAGMMRTLVDIQRRVEDSGWESLQVDIEYRRFDESLPRRVRDKVVTLYDEALKEGESSNRD